MTLTEIPFFNVIPALPSVIPALSSVIPALFSVIPAKAGIQSTPDKRLSLPVCALDIRFHGHDGE